MPFLVFNLNDGQEFVFDLIDERVTLGRDPLNDIVIDNNYVSRYHAQFTKEETGYTLSDLNSLAGTFVNGERIHQSPLSDGDTVCIGELIAEFKNEPNGSSNHENIESPLFGSKSESLLSNEKLNDTLAIPLGERKIANPLSLDSATDHELGFEETKAFHQAAAKNAKAIAELIAEEQHQAKKVANLRLMVNEAEARLSAVATELEQRQQESTQATKEAAAAKALAAQQSKKATQATKKLETLTSKLAEIEARISSEAISDLEGKRTALDSEIDYLEGQRIEKQKAIASAELRERNLRNQIEAAHQERIQSELHLAEINTSITSQQAKLEETTQKEKDLTQKAKNLVLETAKLHQTIDLRKTAEKMLVEVKSEIVASQLKSEELTKQVAALDANRHDLTAEYEKLNNKGAQTLQAQDSKILEQEQTIQKLENRAAELTLKVSELAFIDARLGETRLELKTISDQKTELTAIIVVLNKQRDEATAQLASIVEKGLAQSLLEQPLIKRRLELENQISKLEALLEKASTRHAAKICDVISTEQQLNGKRLAIADYEEQLASLKTKLTFDTSRHEELTKQLANLEVKTTTLSSQHTALTEAHTATASELNLAQLALENALTEHALISSTTTALTSSIKDLKAAEAEHRESHEAALAQSKEQEAKLAETQAELAIIEPRLASLLDQSQSIEKRFAELRSGEANLALANAELLTATQATASLRADGHRLQAECSQLKETLGSLHEQIILVQRELAESLDQLDQATTAAAKVNEEREEAEKATKLLQCEAYEIAKLNSVNRISFDAQLNAKLDRSIEAEEKLLSINRSVARAEQQLEEYNDISKRLEFATQDLKGVKKQHQIETKAVASLQLQQERMRQTLAALEFSIHEAKTQEERCVKQAKIEAARYADATERANAALDTVERLEERCRTADQAIKDARNDEKRLHKDLPGLKLEHTTVSAALADVVIEHNEATQLLVQVHLEEQRATRRAYELKAESDNLQEGIRVREQRLNKLQAEVEQANTQLRLAQDSVRSAELSVEELLSKTTDQKRALIRLQNDLQKEEAETHARAQRLHDLASEEKRLTPSLIEKQAQLAAAEHTHNAQLASISAHETRLAELAQAGGRALSLSEIISSLEARHQESSMALREAAEQEIALRANIAALQEAHQLEAQRLEAAKKDASKSEDATAARLAELQSQVRQLQSLEVQRS